MPDIAIRVDHPCAVPQGCCAKPGRSMSKLYPAVAPGACPESSEGARHLGRAQQRHDTLRDALMDPLTTNYTKRKRQFV